MVIVLLSLFFGSIAILLQATLPRFELMAYQPIQFLILVVIYAALRLKDARTFIVVCLLGFALDLVSGDNRLGVSVIPLTLVASIVLSQAEATIARHWYFQMLLVLVGTFLYLTLTYLIYLIQAWAMTQTGIDSTVYSHEVSFNWNWPLFVWQGILIGSCLNAAIAPFLYFGFNKFLALLGQRESKLGPLQTDVQYILR